MASVWLRTRVELRDRWRAWLVLAIVLGAGLGGSIAAAAGARRAATAFSRFVEATNYPDVVVAGVTDAVEDQPAMFAAVERLPSVADSVRSYTASMEVVLRNGEAAPDLHSEVSPDPRAGRTIAGLKILSGRSADPGRADEATVSFAAERFVALGDLVGIPIRNDEFEVVDHATVRIVGIHASPADFPSVNGAAYPAVFLSPAFYRAHRAALENIELSNTIGIGLTLKPGATAADVREEANRRNLAAGFPSETAELVAGVQRSIRFESGALWVLAGMLGLGVVTIVGQSIARQIHAQSGDYPTLRAVGMSPRRLFAVGMLRAALVGAVAAAVAVAVGIAASPLTPIGLARTAEPAPGIWIDPLVLALGAVVTIAVAAAVSSLPAWRVATARAEAAPRRSSAITRLVARWGGPVSAVSGTRLALERGNGAGAVPIMSATLGTIVGLASLLVAVTFADSLDRLIATPSYSGYRWDLMIAADADPTPMQDALRKDRSVEAVGRGGGFAFSVSGRRLLGYAWDVPSFEPVIARGRLPSGIDEIALGPRTMRGLGVRVGDSVPVYSLDVCQEDCPSSHPDPTPMRVVGVAIVPGFFFEAHEPGDGLAITLPATLRMNPTGRNGPQGEHPLVLVRFRPGTDVDQAQKRIEKAHQVFTAKRQTAGDLASLDNVSHAPFVLAEGVALLSLISLMHALLTCIRRRAHDLAILKTLGFVTRQIRATVAWQASVIAGVAIVVALPLGVAIGRWTWRSFADQLAVLPAPVTAVTTVVWLIPITLVLANLIAAIPGRVAARSRAAEILRVE